MKILEIDVLEFCYRSLLRVKLGMEKNRSEKKSFFCIHSFNKLVKTSYHSDKMKGKIMSIRNLTSFFTKLTE